MIHNRKLNKKINKIHDGALRIVHGDHKTSFLKLLNIEKFVTINKKTLQYSLTEMYKVKKSISPIIMNEMFQFLKILSVSLEVVSIYQPETHVQLSSVLNR